MQIEEFSDRVATLYESLCAVINGDDKLDLMSTWGHDKARRELATLKAEREILWAMVSQDGPEASLVSRSAATVRPASASGGEARIKVARTPFASWHEAILHLIDEKLEAIEAAGSWGFEPIETGFRYKMAAMMVGIDTDMPSHFEVRKDLRREAAAAPRRESAEAKNRPPATQETITQEPEHTTDAAKAATWTIEQADAAGREWLETQPDGALPSVRDFREGIESMFGRKPPSASTMSHTPVYLNVKIRKEEKTSPKRYRGKQGVESLSTGGTFRGETGRQSADDSLEALIEEQREDAKNYRASDRI